MKGKRKFSIRNRLKSFRYAVNGLKLLVLREHNARIHVLATVIAILGGFFLKVGSMEWIVILIVIAIVFIAELFNTALEHLCDFVKPEYNQVIKEVKDLAAGAVLVSAMLAVTIGIILLFALSFLNEWGAFLSRNFKISPNS